MKDGEGDGTRDACKVREDRDGRRGVKGWIMDTIAGMSLAKSIPNSLE